MCVCVCVIERNEMRKSIYWTNTVFRMRRVRTVRCHDGNRLLTWSSPWVSPEDTSEGLRGHRFPPILLHCQHPLEHHAPVFILPACLPRSTLSLRFTSVIRSTIPPYYLIYLPVCLAHNHTLKTVVNCCPLALILFCFLPNTNFPNY